MASRILLDNAAVVVFVDEEKGVVTLARKGTPLDLDVLAQTRDVLDVELPLSQRAKLGLLFDMRKAPFAPPTEEGNVASAARALQEGFLAVSTVFATAMGKLQGSRMRRERGIPEAYIAPTIEDAERHLSEVVARHRKSAPPRRASPLPRVR